MDHRQADKLLRITDTDVTDDKKLTKTAWKLLTAGENHLTTSKSLTEECMSVWQLDQIHKCGIYVML